MEIQQHDGVVVDVAGFNEWFIKSRYFHHHAVVLLDLHQPLPSPC